MIVLGVVLLLIGLFFGVPILWSLGIVVLVIGAVLAIAGGVGRSVGPRRWYY